MTRIAIIGAGGHAKVVISTLRAARREADAIFDDDPSTHGSAVLGVPVVGPLTSVPAREFDGALVAIGTNRIRQKVVANLRLSWTTAISPHAHIDPSVQIGEGTVVFAGAVIQPDAVIGRHCIVNTGATVDHDCLIGDFVHIAPGAHLAGNVTLGENVFLGIGTVVIPGTTIGWNTTVGAGGVVIRDIGANEVAYGVPAKPPTS